MGASLLALAKSIYYLKVNSVNSSILKSIIARRGHGPKKLINFYKTDKQTSVAKFFIFAALRVFTDAEHLKSLNLIGSCSGA